MTIYNCCASFFMFMFINQIFEEIAFNYCAQWSGVDDQKIDCSITSIEAMSHTIKQVPLEEMTSTEYQFSENFAYILDTEKTAAIWQRG